MEQCGFPNCEGDAHYICECPEMRTPLCSLHLNAHQISFPAHQATINTIDIPQGVAGLIISECSKCLSQMSDFKRNLMIKTSESIKFIIENSTRIINASREFEYTCNEVINILKQTLSFVRKADLSKAKLFILKYKDDP